MFCTGLLNGTPVVPAIDMGCAIGANGMVPTANGVVPANGVGTALKGIVLRPKGVCIGTLFTKGVVQNALLHSGVPTVLNEGTLLMAGLKVFTPNGMVPNGLVLYGLVA